MVSKLRELARKFKQRPETTHAALDYMDSFMFSSLDQEKEIVRSRH
jgi:hypothetical protein